MKRKGVLFSVLSALCIGLVAGCGEEKYTLTAVSENNEYGYVTGGGKFALGDSVDLKVYTNLGCQFEKLVHTKADQTTADINNLQKVEDTYYSYSFKLSNDTLGSYKAVYSCQSKEVDTSTKVTKYKVTFKVHLNEDDDYDDSGETFDEEVKNGDKLDESKFMYIGNKKVEWYIDEAKQTKYDFSSQTGVTDNITLYGKVTEISAIDLVAGALKEFNESEKVTVSTTGKSVFAQNLKDTEKFSFVYDEGSEYSVVYAIPKGETVKHFVEYTNKKTIISKMKLNETFNLGHIKETYLKELLAPSYIDLNNLEVSDIIEDNGNYEVVFGEGKNDVISLKIVDRKLKSFIYNTKEYNVSFNGTPTQVQSGVADMFTVVLKSDNTELNTELQKYNVINKVLKVVPSKGETVESQLLKYEELNNKLKAYAYEWYEADSITGACKTTKFDVTKKDINEHLNLCVKVSGKVSDMKNGYDALKEADYTITTTIEDEEMGTLEKTWSSGGVDVTAASNKPDDMLSVVWESLNAVKGFDDITKYYKVEYKDSEYIVYLKEESKLPEIKVTLDNNKLDTIKYLKENSSGEIITYTSEFNYN